VIDKGVSDKKLRGFALNNVSRIEKSGYIGNKLSASFVIWNDKSGKRSGNVFARINKVEKTKKHGKRHILNLAKRKLKI